MPEGSAYWPIVPQGGRNLTEENWYPPWPHRLLRRDFATAMEVIHHLRSCCTHCFQNGPTRWKWLIEIYWNIPKSMTWCKGRTSQFYSQRPAISNSWGFGCAIACPGRRLSWSMAAAGAHFISKKRESFTRHGHGSTLAGLHDDFNIWYMIYIYIYHVYTHNIPMMCMYIYIIYNIIYIYIYIYIL